MKCKEQVKRCGRTKKNTADSDTRGTYKDYLNDKTSGELTTEYSGRVWADKTVTTDDQSFSGDAGSNIEVENDSDFLVTYSALATTQSITGETQSPVDVVFVVDFSGSMISNVMNDNESRLANLLDALNSSINTLMEANKYNRVAVVCYSGMNEDYPKDVAGANNRDSYKEPSKVLLQLDHYQNSNFSVNDRNGESNNNFRTVTWNASNSQGQQVSGSRTIYPADATNTQMGLYTGMKLLTESDATVTIDGQTVRRVPAVIHLSDGNPTVSSDSANWWEPENNSNNGNGVVRWPSAGNCLKALMTASYMKDRINEHYASDHAEEYQVNVYNIGMGLDGIYDEALKSDKGLPSAAQASADVTLKPGDTLFHTNYQYRNDEYSDPNHDSNIKYNTSVVQDIENTWNSYKSSQSPSMDIFSNYQSWLQYDSYTFQHPQNDINTLNYVDQYFAADDADSVTDVFEQIVSDITMSTPQVPTNVNPDAIDHSGYITYTDVIGDYMEVKEVKNLIFSGTNFENPAISTSGNTTTYTFSGKIDSPVYGQQDANDIVITVTSNTDGTGKMTQTLTVQIPASAIPLRVNTVELSSAGKVTSHDTNHAYPVRLCYTVGVQEGVKNADGTVDFSKIDDAYKSANTKDGSLYFYSNKYTGDIVCKDNETAGNSYVEFTPAKNNPYFYVQDSIPLYTDGACKSPVTTQPTPNDGKTYYYRVQYYSGKQSKTEPRSVTGIKGETEQIGGQYYVKAGVMNAPHADSKHAEKSTNNTATAQLYYYAHMDRKTAQIHLGNNGRLAVKTASLAVEKNIDVPDGIDAGQFADLTFPFTVTLKDTNGNPVSGTFTARQVAVDGNGTEATVENGMTSLTFTGGTATFSLKPGEKLYIDGLVNGWSYEVSETDNPDDGFDQTTLDGDAAGTLEDTTATVSFVNTYYPGSIAVTKRDGAGDPLKGAAFQLYKDNGNGDKEKVGDPISTEPRIRQTVAEGTSGFDLEHMIYAASDGKKYPVHTDGTDAKGYFYYRSLTEEEQSQYEHGTLTGYEEVAEFTNLLVKGTYYLQESKVPDGYNAPQTDKDGYLIVGENEQTAVSVPTKDGGNTVYHLLFTVTNHKNMVLPTTGLSGIGRFLTGGVLLLTAAVVLWILKTAKRRTVNTVTRRRRHRRR